MFCAQAEMASNRCEAAMESAVTVFLHSTEWVLLVNNSQHVLVALPPLQADIGRMIETAVKGTLCNPNIAPVRQAKELPYIAWVSALHH